MRKCSTTARLRARNQLTLPETVARQLGAETGDELIFETDENRPTEVRVRRLLPSYGGILKGLYGRTAGEIDAYIREERASWGE